MKEELLRISLVAVIILAGVFKLVSDSNVNENEESAIPTKVKFDTVTKVIYEEKHLAINDHTQLSDSLIIKQDIEGVLSFINY